MGHREPATDRDGRRMPARVGRRDRIARYRMTPIAMSIDRRACPRRAILPRRRLRAGGTRPTDIEIPPKHSASSVRIAEALVRSSPPNALHSAARRPGTNVRLLNMVGRLVGCNASLGGRCSGQAGTALSTDRRAARVGRRIAWRDTERLDRDLDRPARVLAARDLSKARAQGQRDATSRRRDHIKHSAMISCSDSALVCSRRLTPIRLTYSATKLRQTQLSKV